MLFSRFGGMLRNAFRFSSLSFFLVLVTLLCVPLLYIPFLRGSFDLPKEILLYILLSGIFILSLCEIIKTKKLYQKRTVLDIPFLILLGAGLVSTFFSLNSGVSFFGRPDIFVLHFFALFLLMVWSWYLIQKIQSEKLFRISIFVFLLAGVLACILFLVGVNPVAKLNSVFGIYVVTLLTLSLGILIPKAKKVSALFVCASLCALAAFVSLMKLDFQMLWILVTVGMTMLFLMGMAFWGGVRKSVLAVIFALFLFGLLHILLPLLFHFGRALPTEVNLTPTLSKTIVTSELTSSPKNFLFGSGLGTFVYDFSLFRPASVNQHPYFWSLRFDHPWSSLFAWLSEFGFVGTISLLLIILLVFGSILSAILHIRNTFWKRSYAIIQKISFEYFRFEYFVFMIGWILLTVGMCIAVYNFALWFIWWTCTAFVVIGLSYIQPTLVREQEKTFRINPQYVFVFSFFFLVLSSATVVGGVLWGKIVLAEKLVSESQLNSALELRPNSSDYLLTLSKNYLDQSMAMYRTDPSGSAQKLASAIEFALRARDVDPNNVRVFEILSTSYLQTLPYTSEVSRQQSVVWATDAIEHAQRLEPANPVFYSQMGLMQEFLGQFDLAQKSYDTAIMLKPDYLQAYFDLSRLYEKQNKVDAAIGVYEQYRKNYGDNVDMLYELGRLYYNRKNIEDDKKAEKMWLTAVQVDPSSSNALYSLGLLYEKRGENTVARDYMERVHTLNPDNVDVAKKLQSLSP